MLPEHVSQRSACFAPRRASVYVTRITAPFPSSTSFPQLSHTSTVFRATVVLLRKGDFRGNPTETRRVLSSLACASNSPRTQQAEHRLFLRREPCLTRLDDAQMPRAKIVDRSPVAVLLDNRRRDVRLACDGRSISEPFRNTPHDRTDRSLLLGFRLRKSVPGSALCEVDGSQKGAAPGAKVLGAELLAQIDL